MSDAVHTVLLYANSNTVCYPLVADASCIVTCVVALAVTVIASVDVKHVITVSTNVVASECAPAAFVIVPVIVVVYTPATVGVVHDISIVNKLNVINEVLWPLLAVYVAV